MTTPARTAPAQGRHPGPGGATAFWKRKKFMIVAAVVLLALAYLIIVGIQNAAMYYLTAGELLAKGESIGERVRLGGTVAQDSVHAVSGGMTLHFDVTDGQQSIPVTYQGVVPDAFTPGGEVVVEGALTPEGTFNADILLAKCPSKYVPSI
ncbi:MAG: cytochrome c-type biosis protein CcmE [Dehalococcoidia bacterium]|nr:cytochrome c-type biosis protein CcmE [Dehalococcoidia bacterium]